MANGVEFWGWFVALSSLIHSLRMKLSVINVMDSDFACSEAEATVETKKSTENPLLTEALPCMHACGIRMNILWCHSIWMFHIPLNKLNPRLVSRILEECEYNGYHFWPHIVILSSSFSSKMLRYYFRYIHQKAVLYMEIPMGTCVHMWYGFWTN